MKKTNKRLIAFILISCLFLCIGYAEITNTELKIAGMLEASAQEGVFISNVETTDTLSKINAYVGTMLDTKTVLGTASSSEVSYNITLYNNSAKEHIFIGILTDEEDEYLYSNENIEYTLTGLKEYETIIQPNASLRFTITFKYKTGANTSNNILESKLNFRFREKPKVTLSNEGENYTLENIYPGYTPKEYKFTVTNENEANVPMTYSFETTISEPLKAEIYDGTTIVTGNTTLTNGEKEYTLKIVWDESANSTEFANKDYSLKVVLKAKPTNTDYENYEINKEFNVQIKTAAFYFNAELETANITMENNEASLNLNINNNNSASEYNSFDTNYQISLEDSSKFQISITDSNSGVISSGANTNNVTVKITPVEGATINKQEQINLIVKSSKPYVKEISKEVAIEVKPVVSAVKEWINEVPVPVGFEAVEKSSGVYYTEDEGFIIRNEKDENEFVWVPVETFSDFAVLQDGSTTNYRGQLWATKTYNNFGKKNTTYNANSGLREPAVVTGNSTGTGTSFDGAEAYIKAIKEEKYSTLLEQFQEEFNYMAKSVKKYGGFYVGRYETSWDGTKVASKGGISANQIFTSATDLGSSWITGRSDNKATWYGLYAKQKELYTRESNSSVVSGMIYGAEWDAIMNWMKDIPNVSDDTTKFITNSTGMGNYTGSDPATGYYAVNNIYDLAGNWYEFTLEAADMNYRTIRGGDYSGKGSYNSASFRGGVYPKNVSDYHSSRLQLYIKDYIQAVPVETVSITGESTVAEGGTIQLTATVLPEDATDKTVVWTSSDNSVATVDETGLVTGITAGGTVTISATADGITGTYEVTVEEGFALSGSGTEASPYLISDADDLIFLAEQVNSGEPFTGTYFEVTNNIDLNYMEYGFWTPIGNVENWFDGEFDGNGYSISNFHTGYDYDYYGLFGHTGLECVITNLIVQGSYAGTDVEDENDYVGTLVGYSGRNY